MPYRGYLAEHVGNPPYVDFGGTTLTAFRAFSWDHSTQPPGTPVLANSTTTHVSGVVSEDGKGGFLAVPGGIVLIEVETSASITAGTVYNVNSTGQLSATTGNHFKALTTLASSVANSTGVLRRIIAVEFWKPKG